MALEGHAMPAIGSQGKNMEEDMEEDKGKWKDGCIVVCPRREFVKPWIRAYFASGNRIPLVIADGLNEWDAPTREYLEAAAQFTGGMVFDCSEACERSRSLASRACSRNKGWYSKKLILHAVATRLSPSIWAWVDDDIEVTGKLDECMEKAEKVPGFVYTQFYFPDEGDQRHPLRTYRSRIDKGDKIAWGSFMFFHGDANERLVALDRDFKVEDDEVIFADLYKSDPAWHNGFYDFSMCRWQCICKTPDRIPLVWRGKAIHYAAGRENNAVKNMWAAKGSRLPRAPFEEAPAPAACSPGDEVDAVFVIGKGSLNGNEELRYALRDLDAFCKFVRNVYICGECPSWVDRTVVRHIQWPDRFTHAKDANIIDKLLRACEEPDIAKRVLFCSDDQFVTRECSWEDFSPRYLRRYRPDDSWYATRKRVWHTRLRATMERDRERRAKAGLDVNNVFYYQPHMWMQIDRDEFMRYASWSDYPHRKDTIIASGYFNFVDADGQPNFDHSFLKAGESVDGSTTHVGYLDSSYGAAMSYLRVAFPRKCRFER